MPDWFFASLHGYRIGWLPRDIIAGIMLAAIAIPGQFATARLAGMPPETGLYAFAAGSVFFAAFGANRFMSVAADSATLKTRINTSSACTASDYGCCMSVGTDMIYRSLQRPRRRVVIWRDDKDFIIACQPADLVIFRNADADALRKACLFLRWEVVSDTLPVKRNHF